MLRLIEEGVSLAPLARASGISLEELEQLPVARRSKVADAEELGQAAARLAWRAVQEGERLLDEGSEASRIRLITAITGHPLRRMQTDTSKTQAALQTLLEQILYGGSPLPDEPEEGDDTEVDDGG